MVRSLRRSLDRAVADTSTQRIVIRSEVPGTFCAGGDIRAVRDQVLEGRIDEAMQFFEEEFALNHAIANCPKPFVALIDGTCSGGGCGLALHAAYSLVTEKA